MFQDPMVYDVFKTALTFLGGLIAAFIGQAAARRNAKATEKTSELDVMLKPLVSANTAWEALSKPMIDRIDKLEKHVGEMESEGKEREGQLLKAISLLVTWGSWIESGAAPPPPAIPSWLRDQMIQVVREANDEK